jgi:hypothetical protein
LLIAPVVLKQAADTVQGGAVDIFAVFCKPAAAWAGGFFATLSALGKRGSCILYSLRNQTPFFDLFFMLLEYGKCIYFYRHTWSSSKQVRQY